MSFMPDLSTHFTPRSFSDRLAFRLCQMLRWMADTYFKKQYGHRALVIETVASIPGMVGAFFTHMRCLRKRIKDDENKIQNLLNEAANERIHFLVSKVTWPICRPSNKRKSIMLRPQIWPKVIGNFQAMRNFLMLLLL